MKPVLFEVAKRWSAGLSAALALAGLIAVPFAARGADSLWYSPDHAASFDNNNLPIIDATNFWNKGTWNIGVNPFPYKTSDTLFYTNSGLMASSVGWQFDLGPANSGTSLTLRNAAGIFFNDGTGIIESDDNRVISSSGIATYVSYLWVTATNIVNKGYLKAGSSGEIWLVGTNINLSRGYLEIIPTSGNAKPAYTTRTNVTPAKSISYERWAQTNMNFSTSDLWDGTFFSIPRFSSAGLCGETVFASRYFLAFNNYTFYTNKLAGFATTSNSLGMPERIEDDAHCTNYIHAAVFVMPPADPTITADVRYLASLNPSNNFDTVTLKLAQTITNLITLTLQTNSLFIVDVLASSTNRGLFRSPPNVSSVCSDPTFQAANYIISRSDMNLSFGGDLWPFYYFYLDPFGTNVFEKSSPGVRGLPPGNFLFDTSWTNDNSTAAYASEYLTVNSITTLPPAGTSLDHAGGRVKIYAGNLNLGRMRMNGEGWINVRCGHLVDSVGAYVDCQNLSYDLGSTNGTLLFTNLVLPSVSRFQGSVLVWSATWSNLTTKQISTYIPAPGGGGGFISTNLPVAVVENLYVMGVDATNMGVSIPVQLLDLKLHSTTNIILGDAVFVTNSFFLDGLGFTIQKQLVLNNAARNWISTNAPRLAYFTNNGLLSIPNNAHFGDDRTNKYQAFINNGIILSGGQSIDSAIFQVNNGINATMFSDFSVITRTGLLANATIRALNVNAYIATNGSIVVTNFQPGGGAVSFFADNLQINNSSLYAYNPINFSVTNILADSGVGAANNFYCFYGFNLLTRPTAGDLLGTVIWDIAEGQEEIDHNWAGADAGAVAAGFTDHTAIGSLVLFPASSFEPSGMVEPLFAFYGTTGGNAMYVNHLDLSYLTDFTNELYIDPSITIYYASASLNPDVTHPGYGSAEAYLNNNPSLFGPRLRWVSGVSIPAPHLQAEGSALSQRYKLTASYNAASDTMQLGTEVMFDQTNVIQASTDLLHWVNISTNIGSYTNLGTTVVQDSSTSNYPNRFYRAKPWP
jgi:hypothetical protein